MLKDSMTVNGLVLPNRLVLPPMATAKSTPEGLVTDELCTYYADRAANGLIISEHMYIDSVGKASKGQVSIAGDETIPGLRKLTDAVHAAGGRIIAQLNHAGAAAKPEHGETTIGPSLLPMAGSRAGIVAGKAMTQADIDGVVSSFVSASKRAISAGFDGVEIHSAHGYLLDQFYSPLTNGRTDEYGGDLSNRIRLHLQILSAVRNAVGPDIPISIRLGAYEGLDGGATLPDSVSACRAFEAAGADLISISGGMTGYMRKDNTSPGWFSDISSAVKAAVSIPVLLTGGIKTVESAEDLLSAGTCDLIGVGRAQLVDADWASSALQ